MAKDAPLPQKRSQGLTFADAVISVFLLYVNFAVSGFYLARPQSRRRGLHICSNTTNIIARLNKPSAGKLRMDHAPIARAISNWLRPGKQIPGNADFDGAFTIHSEPRDFAVAVLASPKLRQRVLYLREQTAVEVSGEWLSLERSGLEKDVDCLCCCLDLMSDLACAVEEAVTPPPVRR